MSREAESQRSLPAPISDRLDAWKSLWVLSARLHYILGGASALCAAISATGLLWSQAFAAASAVLTALFAFIQPERKYFKMVRAWRVLDSAAIRYQLGLGSLDELHKALDRGEQLITDYESSEAQPPREQSGGAPKPPPPPQPLPHKTTTQLPPSGSPPIPPSAGPALPSGGT